MCWQKILSISRKVIVIKQKYLFLDSGEYKSILDICFPIVAGSYPDSAWRLNLNWLSRNRGARTRRARQPHTILILWQKLRGAFHWVSLRFIGRYLTPRLPTVRTHCCLKRAVGVNPAGSESAVGDHHRHFVDQKTCPLAYLLNLSRGFSTDGQFFAQFLLHKQAYGGIPRLHNY